MSRCASDDPRDRTGAAVVIDNREARATIIERPGREGQADVHVSPTTTFAINQPHASCLRPDEGPRARYAGRLSRPYPGRSSVAALRDRGLVALAKSGRGSDLRLGGNGSATLGDGISSPTGIKSGTCSTRAQSRAQRFIGGHVRVPGEHDGVRAACAKWKAARAAVTEPAALRQHPVPILPNRGFRLRVRPVVRPLCAGGDVPLIDHCTRGRKCSSARHAQRMLAEGRSRGNARQSRRYQGGIAKYARS